MTAGDVYRCGLDWCSDSRMEWWTIPLFVVGGLVAVVGIVRAVRAIRRERSERD